MQFNTDLYKNAYRDLYKMNNMHDDQSAKITLYCNISCYIML